MISQIVSPRSAEFTPNRLDVVPGLMHKNYITYAQSSARIYHAQTGSKQSEWTYSRMKGSLVFGRDKDTPGEAVSYSVRSGAVDYEKYWFRLIDEEQGRTVWAFKVPPGFVYQVDRPFFHVFQGRSRRFGFLFEDDDEAVAFGKKVLEQVCPIKPQKTRSMRGRATSTTSPSGLSAKIISAPTPNSFVHVAHVGVNNKGVIETSRGLDPVWKTVLADLQGYRVSKSIVLDHLDFVEGFWRDVDTVRRRNSEDSTTTEDSRDDAREHRLSRRRPALSALAI